MLSKHDFIRPRQSVGRFYWNRLTLPTPFPVGPVNAYLLPAEPLTLIDTGPDTQEARDSLASALAGMGLRPQDIARVVITHGHSDHAGLAAWFRENKAEVFIHPLEAEKLSGLDFWPARREYLRQLGVPDELLEAAHSLARRTASFRGGCLTDFRPLQEGDTLEFNGFSLAVLAVPGHTGGHLAFYQEENGVLLCGDTLLNKISPNPLAEVHPDRPGKRSGSLSQFLSTMDRLKELEPELVLPGHGEALREAGQRIAGITDHHRQRLQQIRGMVQARGPCSPFELASQLYGRLSGWDVLLAVSEVSAHLDWLAARGDLEETADYTGRLTYQIL